MNDIYNDLKEVFPNLVQTSDIENCVASIVNNSINTNLQSPDRPIGLAGLFILQTKDKIWLRNVHACSGYPIKDKEELIEIIDGILHDEVFWVMEYKNDEWFGTSLIDSHDDIKVEDDVVYQILSWSGLHDKLLG